MDRSEPVAEAFADLTQTLVGDFDLAEVLDRIIRHCATVCGAAGVGLVINDANHMLRDIAYSDDQVRQLERHQSSHGEGPCFDCVQTGRQVIARDLTTTHARWPRFTPAALEAGFTGARALPLRHHGRALGALNLFDRESDACTDDSLPVAQTFADLAMLAVLQHALPAESAAVHVTYALAARSAIERAKGMLAHDADCSPGHAFEVLSAHAARTGQATTALARALVSGEVTTADVLATPEPQPGRT